MQKRKYQIVTKNQQDKNLQFISQNKREYSKETVWKAISLH